MRFFLFSIVLLPSLISAQDCDCCKLQSSGQKKYDAGDFKGARATWENAKKMPDASKCPQLSKLLWKTRDADGDGIVNGQDDCPNTPGIASNGGCPPEKQEMPKPSDRDGDGVLDVNDQCPDSAGPSSLRGCPDTKDDDEDGTPNVQDDCPTVYGPKQYRGCPDRDFDETPDILDACPDTPGPKNTAGCPDRDADGIADKDDKCLDVPGLMSLNGCPDRDGDGVVDASDDCPDILGLKRFNGCPDKDFDETPDNKDACPDTPGPKTANGCPDRDADGVADKDDQCPDQPGESMNKGCPGEKLIQIKGGSYTMGDLFGDVNSGEEQHAVTVSDFSMEITEVTFDDYDAFCTATQRDKPGDNGWGRGQRPVINVDWYDAVEYCNWLSMQEKLAPAYTLGKTRLDPDNLNRSDPKKWTVTVNWAANGYRLPTEAEWEYAAREGGKKVRFGNGKDIADPAQINFDGSENYKQPYSVVGEFRQKTVPVGGEGGASNGLGLRHMSGNVLEWCQDWYGPGYYGESNGVSNPKGPKSGQYRVVRGGCWYADPGYCRSSYRAYGYPGGRFNYVGFRVVRNL